jgi:hypothetical protein
MSFFGTPSLLASSPAEDVSQIPAGNHNAPNRLAVIPESDKKPAAIKDPPKTPVRTKTSVAGEDNDDEYNEEYLNETSLRILYKNLTNSLKKAEKDKDTTTEMLHTSVNTANRQQITIGNQQVALGKAHDTIHDMVQRNAESAAKHEENYSKFATVLEHHYPTAAEVATSSTRLPSASSSNTACRKRAPTEASNTPSRKQCTPRTSTTDQDSNNSGDHHGFDYGNRVTWKSSVKEYRAKTWTVIGSTASKVKVEYYNHFDEKTRKKVGLMTKDVDPKFLEVEES